MVVNQVGPPVRGKNCYGREATVDLIWEKLSRGHVLLAAPRRFGKTSLIYRLLDEPRWDYKVLVADLEHLAEPAEFITSLAELLVRDRQLGKLVRGLSYLPKTLWSGFRNTVEEVELYKLRVKLRGHLRPRWQESGEELLKKLADAPNPVVLMLDEFPMMIDRMARSEAHREEARTFLRWLRSIRQSPGHQNVRFLVAGSIGIGGILNQLSEASAINDFEQIRLEPFSPNVAHAFLDELSQAQETPLSPQSKRKMVELIGILVPYFLQVLFSEVRKVYLQDRQPISPGDVERIYHEKVLGVDCKTYFDHYYGRLRIYYQPQEEKPIKPMLRALAEVGSLTRDACYQCYRDEVGAGAELEQFNRLMVELENDFYIRFAPRARRYEFASKLLRDWWLRHYGMGTEM